ncbi:MAG TPA: phage holin family protein [Conexibacter sp.]|nr:phage holin family protein [Conexibacter sp.]
MSAEGATPTNGRELRDESIAELVKRLAEQTNTLVHQEIELAKAELTQKGRIAGAGAGMLGAAAVIGLLAAGALTACFVALLALWIGHTWIGALIVAAVYAAIAAPLALRGRDRIRAATPPAPEETIESVKEDVAWARTRTRSATR